MSNQTVVWGLVAAGVVLCGHQYQSRPLRGGLDPRRPVKRVQDADYGGVRGEDAEAHGGHYGKAENERHEKRNHVQPPLS